MYQQPVFKPHLRAHVLPEEGVFVLSETHQAVLQGRLYEQVAPLLDGRPTAEVCAQLQDAVSPAEVLYTLRHLGDMGYLMEAGGPLPAGEAALWSIEGLDPSEAAARLSGTAVALTVFGDVDAGPLRELLGSLHVRVAEDGSRGLVVTDHYLREGLEGYNRAALAAGRPWLLLRPGGCQVWVGPVFRPGQTGCWECLAQRLRANRPLVGYLHGRGALGGDHGLDCCRTAATRQAAWGLAATAVAAWVARGEAPQLEGRIQTLDLRTWESQGHALLRLPTCPACGAGGPPPQAGQVVLVSRKKVPSEDGGHRSVPPEETLARFGHLVSPISGVVPLIERPPQAAAGVMHVYLSGNNIARGPRTWAGLVHDLRGSSCGKGASDAQARASALGEAVERYSGAFRGDEPRRRARLGDLGEDGIHPNACMLISDRQYRERDAWNARTGIYHQVPDPFDPAAEIDWAPVWSLSRGRHRYLPTAFCYYCYPEDGAGHTCVGCSNGNAAGATREEAVLQGLLELVERDGVALWWYNRARRPAIDLDSFADPYVDELRDYLATRRRELWALDLTSDLDIPVTVALSRRTDGPAEQVLFGFGAHLDPRVALLRAVTELNQMLIYILDAPPDGPTRAHLTDPETLAWLRTAGRADHPYLVPAEGPAQAAAAYPRAWTDDLRDDIEACRARLERRGLEVLVLDQTRPEVGVPVVKVVVPGLRHFWARFAPGRLYDVPARLGWVPRPLAEEELNPVPMFL